MPGLAHDGCLAGAVPGCRRGEPAAQRMAGIGRGIKAGGFGCALHDQHHRLVAQALGADRPTLVDRPEQRPVRADPGQPRLDRAHRAGCGIGAVADRDLPADAFLIGLRDPDGDRQPFLAHGDIASIKRHQFGAAKGPGEPQQQ